MTISKKASSAPKLSRKPPVQKRRSKAPQINRVLISQYSRVADC